MILRVKFSIEKWIRNLIIWESAKWMISDEYPIMLTEAHCSVSREFCNSEMCVFTLEVLYPDIAYEDFYNSCWSKAELLLRRNRFKKIYGLSYNRQEK